MLSQFRKIYWAEYGPNLNITGGNQGQFCIKKTITMVLFNYEKENETDDDWSSRIYSKIVGSYKNKGETV